MPWRAADYAKSIPGNSTGRKEDIEAKLLAMFPVVFDPPKLFPAVPATVVDRDGVVVMWYLPEVLTAAQRVRRHFNTVKCTS